MGDRFLKPLQRGASSSSPYLTFYPAEFAPITNASPSTVMPPNGVETPALL